MPAVELPEDRGEWTMSRCSVADALDVVGNRITLLLVREALFGTTRFDDFAERVGASQPAVAKRLAALVEHGILELVPYRDAGQRGRFEYRPTQKGRDLGIVIAALRQWGDAWTSGDAGPPLRATHRACGALVRVEQRCERGHRVVAGDIGWQGLDGVTVRADLEPSDSPTP